MPLVILAYSLRLINASLADFEKLTDPDTSEASETYVVIEQYECSICSSTTPSTYERPMGMISLMQSTCVLNYARIKSEPDTLPLKRGEQGVDRDTIYSSYYKLKSHKLSKLFTDPVSYVLITEVCYFLFYGQTIHFE